MKKFIIPGLVFILSALSVHAAIRKQIEIEHLFSAKIAEFDEFGGRRHEYAVPLVSGNELFLGSTTGNIAVINKSSGSIKLRIQDSLGMESKPLFYKSVLYFGLNNGLIKAYSYRTAGYIWTYSTGFPVHSSPCVSAGILLINSSDDVLHALDADTGKLLWSKKNDFPAKRAVIRGSNSPYCDKETVYAGFSDGSFMALNIFDGSVIWEKNLNPKGKFRDVDAYPYVDDTRIIVPSYDGSLFSLKKENGALLWEVKDGSAKGVRVYGEQVYFPSNEGYLYSINIKDGSIKWKTPLPKGIPTSPVVYKDKYLVFGSSEEGFMVLNKDTGEFLGKFNTGTGTFADPVIEEDKIYMLSNYGILYVFGIRLLPFVPDRT